MTEVAVPGGAELLVALERAGVLSATGLRLDDPQLPIGQAEAIGVLLGRMHMSLRFAIGDWLLFIENVYPAEWSQLAEALNLSEETRREYMRVSERVAHTIRRPKLDWSHHRAVASLPPPEQKQWLARADRERLSHHALREALRNGADPEAATACRCCGRPLDAR